MQEEIFWGYFLGIAFLKLMVIKTNIRHFLSLLLENVFYFIYLNHTF